MSRYEFSVDEGVWATKHPLSSSERQRTSKFEMVSMSFSANNHLLHLRWPIPRFLLGSNAPQHYVLIVHQLRIKLLFVKEATQKKDSSWLLAKVVSESEEETVTATMTLT
ncbi:hypothetical protein NPIL_25961 [Nephila pilipes]|uniref:Uncharacterized protein n=1 Tax=Nephila pilipes TaxID=299642 RepID=A0A8X6TM37_NEPPI|nr:hypothetical protein NPIL_525661 [Nephila pilipes]GFT30024.1 hypothetical protein NPIL_25961 [Nephila pilipes]